MMKSYIVKRGFAIVGRHSKNVAVKKNKLDAMKTKLYNRIAIKIIMAAKSNGIDPNVNISLARALKEAEAINLPKENIDRAIKKATEIAMDDYSSGVYEVYGYSGTGIVIVTLTNNSNRTVKEIKRIVRKADMKMASNGSVLFNFEQKGLLQLPSLGSHTEETILETMLEAGIDIFNLSSISPDNSEEIEDNSEDRYRNRMKYEIRTSPETIGMIHDVLDSLGIGQDVVTSIMYVPSERIVISEEDYERNRLVIEELEEIEDIDRIFHNMQDLS